MNKILYNAAALALAACFTAAQLLAQTSPAPAPARGGGGGGRKEYMDLASARKMAAVVEAAAAAANEHVAICIMDANGEMVLSERMDQMADRIPIATSQGKARAVLLLGVSTGQMADAIREHKPVPATLSAPPIGGGGGEITLMRGGLPIMKDGKMIGSIGVGGSSSENDEKYAQLALDALKK